MWVGEVTCQPQSSFVKDNENFIMNSKIFLLVAPCLLNLSLSTTSQAATVTNSYVFY